MIIGQKSGRIYSRCLKGNELLIMNSFQIEYRSGHKKSAAFAVGHDFSLPT